MPQNRTEGPWAILAARMALGELGGRATQQARCKKLRRAMALLLETAAKAKPIQCISGEDRVLLYILACYTGFRRNEISSLTRQSLDLSRDPPTLTVQAACSKRRRVDVLPLRKDVTELLKHWLDKHPNLAPDEPLLNIRNRYTAKMLRKDLQQARKTWIEAAKAPAEKQAREQSSFLCYIDECGRVADFHALRKTFITNLCLAGVSPKAAQTLARHSDINLTMNVYTLLTVHDQASAVEALPPVPGRERFPNKRWPRAEHRHSLRVKVAGNGRQRDAPAAAFTHSINDSAEASLVGTDECRYAASWSIVND